jgi:cold shock CspA family protein
MTHTGEVVFYSGARGFGFIQEFRQDAEKRLRAYYFHINDVYQQLSLRAGDPVTLQTGISKRSGKPCALDVRLIRASVGLNLVEIAKIDGGAR